MKQTKKYTSQSFVSAGDPLFIGNQKIGVVTNPGSFCLDKNAILIDEYNDNWEIRFTDDFKVGVKIAPNKFHRFMLWLFFGITFKNLELKRNYEKI